MTGKERQKRTKRDPLQLQLHLSKSPSIPLFLDFHKMTKYPKSFSCVILKIGTGNVANVAGVGKGGIWALYRIKSRLNPPFHLRTQADCIQAPVAAAPWPCHDRKANMSMSYPLVLPTCLPPSVSRTLSLLI